MTSDVIVVVLSLSTFAAVLIFSLVSKARTDRRLEDDDAPKSRLARDAPDQ